jgi:group I intron endonuclease
LSYGIIYKAVSLGGKVYIGQTTYTLAHRKAGHAFRTKKGNLRDAFHVALINEGYDSFTWDKIDTAETREKLDQKEKYWIAHYQSGNPQYGYNSTSGGIRFTHSEETKQKLSEAMRGEKSHCFGKHRSEETRRKIGEASRRNGQKISKLLLGNKNSRKITEAVARAIKNDLQNGTRNCDVARRYGVTEGIVKHIKSGKTWSCLQI